MSRVECCRACGGLFPFLARGVCGECLGRSESEFELVRDFLRERPGARIAEVVQVTGVDEPVILRFIREGRLERLPGTEEAVTCELCDRAIGAGRHCDPCRARLLHAFAPPPDATVGAASGSSPSRNRMHVGRDR